MDKNSKSNFLSLLKAYREEGKIPSSLLNTLEEFYHSYRTSVQTWTEENDKTFIDFVKHVCNQVENPFPFAPYHHRVLAPFNYYKFGIDFLRPLVDKKHSLLVGEEHLKQVEEHLQQGHNIIFFANHQTEADPHAISILFEGKYDKLAEEMIFVAGARVTSDLLAIPFSMGRNLLCIYSKRYIDHPPEKKAEKQHHNKKTMQMMSALLSGGGKCIYVAPSGGRDRKNAKGEIEIARFDPQSVEMFYLMAKRAKKPTYFFPMTLSTYNLMPPPETIQIQLGEQRYANWGPIHIAIGPEIDMEAFPGSDAKEKHVRRKARSEYIWNMINREYRNFPE